MADTITFQPDSKSAQVKIDLRDGRIMKLTKGAVLKRGDVSDAAFDMLAKRPDFGGDPKAYAEARARKFGDRHAPPSSEPRARDDGNAEGPTAFTKPKKTKKPKPDAEPEAEGPATEGQE